MADDGTWLKRLRIKFARYVLKKKFIRVMGQPLEGFWWTTSRSYEYLLGTYESPELMRQFLSWLKPESIYYDVGGNVGYHAFIAATVVKNGKVISFEPLPANRALFEEHIRLNQNRLSKDAITLLPYAVADAEKTVLFTNNEQLSGSNTYIDSPLLGTAVDKIPVQCYSVDGLIAQGYPPPDVLKIDVEGAEFDVLRGAAETIRKHRPNIFLATHDVHLPGVKDQCLKFLQEMGYTVTRAEEFNPRMAGLDDFLCVPAGRS